MAIKNMNWSIGARYHPGDTVNMKGLIYECLHLHNGNDWFKPGYGDYWRQVWKYVSVEPPTILFSNLTETVEADWQENLSEDYPVTWRKYAMRLQDEVNELNAQNAGLENDVTRLKSQLKTLEESRSSYADKFQSMSKKIYLGNRMYDMLLRMLNGFDRGYSGVSMDEISKICEQWEDACDTEEAAGAQIEDDLPVRYVSMEIQDFHLSEKETYLIARAIEKIVNE